MKEVMDALIRKNRATQDAAHLLLLTLAIGIILFILFKPIS